MLKMWYNRICYNAEGGAGGGGTGAEGGQGQGNNSGTQGGGQGQGGGNPPASGGGNDFLSQLPEEYRTDPTFKDLKDVGSLAKSYKNAASMLGMDKSRLVALPGENATPEELADFYGKLGRPEAADKYQLPQLEDIPGFTSIDSMKEGFKKVAHENGLTTKQVENLFKWYHGENVNFAKSMEEQRTNSRTQAEESLKKEFGNGFDEKIAVAQKAYKVYADPDMQDLLEESGLANDPSVVKFFAKLGEGIKEDTIVGGKDGSGGNFKRTPAEAQAMINSKYGDKDFMTAYNDKMHPGHKDAVTTMERLFSDAYPSG